MKRLVASFPNPKDNIYMDEKDDRLPEGASVTLTYPDGTIKHGFIMEWDNNTCHISLNDGTFQIIGG